MIRALKILALLVVILVSTVLAIFLTGKTASVVGWLLMPGHDWDPVRTAPAPDYARAGNWAAFPGKASFALFSPLGVSNQPGPHPVDVFFIHPTGYLNHAEWNSPLNPDSRTEENTRWMMANQASVFSGCCNIYAPRYREASLFRYLGSASPEIIKKTMDLAYGDVERAFQYYLEHENHGRPFIIASHSQGSEHGIRLLQNQIDGRPIARQLVAAYLIGNRLMTNARVAMLKTIPVCDSPGEVGCLIHWATYGPGAKIGDALNDDLVCVNPLTWERDGGSAPATLQRGGVPASGRFSLKMWGNDSPQGVVFDPLGAPIPKHTGARCEHGMLFVDDQAGTPFGGRIGLIRNYHGLDYPLFHMDIRENARFRIASYCKNSSPACSISLR